MALSISAEALARGSEPLVSLSPLLRLSVSPSLQRNQKESNQSATELATLSRLRRLPAEEAGPASATLQFKFIDSLLVERAANCVDLETNACWARAAREGATPFRRQWDWPLDYYGTSLLPLSWSLLPTFAFARVWPSESLTRINYNHY